MSAPHIVILGVGGALSTDFFNSNYAIYDPVSDRYLLVDCGSDIKHSLKAAGVPIELIEAVYISHLHADHVGGIEYFTWCSAFSSLYREKNPELPILFLPGSLWVDFSSMFLPTLGRVPGGSVGLDQYYRIFLMTEPVVWRGYRLTCFRVPHFVNATGEVQVYSHALRVERLDGGAVLFTTDTCACLPFEAYRSASITVHDTRFGGPRVGAVHVPFEVLEGLPKTIKANIALTHCRDSHADVLPDVGAAGFTRYGILKQGQIIDFP